LLGSHYDEYVFHYFTYEAGTVQPGAFDKLEQFLSVKECPCLETTRLEASHHLQQCDSFHLDLIHVDEHFKDFKDLHGKQYESEVEHRLGQQTYHNNLRYIA
jgi:hypothetical protein